MTTLQKQKTFKDIEQEYDDLFKNDSVRDEDRAYRWHALCLKKQGAKSGAILDVACGGGYFLRELKKVMGADVKLSGTDISSQALELAKKECPEASYYMAVAESLPFQDNTFDAITCLGSLEHFLDIPKAIKEMRRVVKPGGSFYIMVPNVFWYKDLLSVVFTGDKKDRNQTQERFACLGEWKRTLEDAGLRVIKPIKYNGIAKYGWKQFLKDILIPLKFSYHFIYICEEK